MLDFLTKKTNYYAGTPTGVGSIGAGDDAAVGVAFRNKGASSSIPSKVRVNPDKSPAAAPVTTVPPVTSIPFSNPHKKLLP